MPYTRLDDDGASRAPQEAEETAQASNLSHGVKLTVQAESGAGGHCRSQQNERGELTAPSFKGQWTHYDIHSFVDYSQFCSV